MATFEVMRSPKEREQQICCFAGEIAAAAQASLLEHCAAGMAEYLAEGEFA